MQRVRVTDRGLQASFGPEILTIDRVNDHVMGDSFSFYYRGSFLTTDDIMHGPDSNTTGIFKFGSRDAVDLMIGGMSRLFNERQPKTHSRDKDNEFHDFPEEHQRFYEYTADEHTRIAAIGVSSLAVKEIMLENTPENEELEKLRRLVDQLIARAETMLSFEGTGISKTPDRPEFVAFGYPLGVVCGDTVLLVAEQKQEELTITVNNAARERMPIPSFSMRKLTEWMKSNFEDPALKKKSIWG